MLPGTTRYFGTTLVKISAVEWRGDRMPANPDGTITLPANMGNRPVQTLHRVLVRLNGKWKWINPKQLSQVPNRSLTPAM